MSKKLDNTSQMNEVEQKAGRIYERNPDTGELRSREAGIHGDEKIEEKEYLQDKMNAMHYDIQGRVRREVLNELWSANKVNHNGHWYVQLSQVVNIIGDYNELYENESK